MDEDLEWALRRDDASEDAGMHPDERVTCWTCQSWASDSHRHDVLTGRLVSA